MDSKEQQIVYSQPIPAGKRRYFFDVKETHGGDRYITITDSRRIFDDHTGQFHFEKSKLFLYKEDFDKFRHALDNALSFIETGIEPEPVVVERAQADDADRRLEEIDFKY